MAAVVAVAVAVVVKIEVVGEVDAAAVKDAALPLLIQLKKAAEGDSGAANKGGINQAKTPRSNGLERIAAGVNLEIKAVIIRTTTSLKSRKKNESVWRRKSGRLKSDERQRNEQHKRSVFLSEHVVSAVVLTE